MGLNCEATEGMSDIAPPPPASSNKQNSLERCIWIGDLCSKDNTNK